MECKNAYTQPKIPYVLCRKEKTPTGFDRTELFHAVCIHQVHCPKQNCHKLTPEWKDCFKLAEKPQEAAQAAPEKAASVEPEAQKAPQRGRKQAKTED